MNIIPMFTNFVNNSFLNIHFVIIYLTQTATKSQLRLDTGSSELEKSVGMWVVSRSQIYLHTATAVLLPDCIFDERVVDEMIGRSLGCCRLSPYELSAHNTPCPHR